MYKQKLVVRPLTQALDLQLAQAGVIEFDKVTPDHGSSKHDNRNRVREWCCRFPELETMTETLDYLLSNPRVRRSVFRMADRMIQAEQQLYDRCMALDICNVYYIRARLYLVERDKIDRIPGKVWAQLHTFYKELWKWCREEIKADNPKKAVTHG